MKRKKVLLLVAIVISCSFFVYFFLQWSSLFQNETSHLPLQQMKNEVRDEIQSLKLRKLIKHRDLVLQKENFTQISSYQKYVTPHAPEVLAYITSQNIVTPQDAYATAVDWIWVSDITLHGKPELWLFPAAFIQDTPQYPTNPVPGNMVSDCESQAYTLVSILEAIGVQKSNVRVVVGEVNFSGEVGGHAWVQFYQNGKWVDLEATSGPFWDDDDNKLVENTGFPFNFFRNHPYPVEEYWAFFNDRYFYNPHSGKQSTDLPAHWFL